MTLMKSFFGGEFEVTPLYYHHLIGLNRDYYIALGLSYKGFYEFPFKKFYWTTSANYMFAPLPEPNDQHKKDANERDTLFFGEPEKILIEVKQPDAAAAGEADPNAGGEPKVEEKKESLDESNEAKPEIIPKNFTELDRLAYVVAAIENDTHVVPEGAFKLIPKHEIRRNDGYKGLERKELTSLDKYYHFRNVQVKDKKILLETNESVFRTDIFDPIIKDNPKGAWSVQTDSSGSVATVRSLLWPGYVAYNVTGTKIFGGVYFGDGLKNKDLPFML